MGEIQKPNKSAEQIGEVSRIRPPIWGEGAPLSEQAQQGAAGQEQGQQGAARQDLG